MSTAPRLYCIGYESQARVDRLYASAEGCDCVLIDNSRDGHEIRAPFGEYIRKPGDGLFTSAANYALDDALRRECTAILINDDIVLEPYCIERLAMTVEEGAGIVAPLNVALDNPQQVIFGGGAKAFPAGEHAVGPRQMFFEPSRQFWVTFACAAINHRCRAAIGEMDPNMLMYFSDSDYCMRADWHGWTVLLDPRAVVRHEHSVSTHKSGDEVSGQCGAWMLHDQAIFAAKWGGEQARRMSHG